MHNFPPKIIPLEPHQELQIIKLKQQAQLLSKYTLVEMIAKNARQAYVNQNRIESRLDLTFEQELHLKAVDKYYQEYPHEVLAQAAIFYLHRNLLFENMVIHQEQQRNHEKYNSF